ISLWRPNLWSSRASAAVTGFKFKSSIFQFHFSNFDKKRPCVERVISWAHPELLRFLKYKQTTGFLDGTFRCVPRGFYQVLVFMVYHHESDCYVPVFHILCTSKIEIYQKLDPAEVVCDLEAGLINAAKVQCPQSRVVLCHFKQAARRSMKELRVHEAEVNIAMSRGVLYMLTVIDPGTILTPGIRWVHHLIQRRRDAECILHSTDKWHQFWRNFRRTWLTKYPPALWNVHTIHHDLIMRTNKQPTRAIQPQHP
ncbi:TPA: hypothetical protein N0F65_003034, partial [Lagenidium giganteum]